MWHSLPKLGTHTTVCVHVSNVSQTWGKKIGTHTTVCVHASNVSLAWGKKIGTHFSKSRQFRWAEVWGGKGVWGREKERLRDSVTRFSTSFFCLRHSTWILMNRLKQFGELFMFSKIFDYKVLYLHKLVVNDFVDMQFQSKVTTIFKTSKYCFWIPVCKDTQAFFHSIVPIKEV